MKKLNLLLVILISLIVLSCSNSDEPENQNLSGILDKWTIEEYDSNNELSQSVEHIISNNKITSSSTTTYFDSETTNSLINFNYDGNLLTNTQRLSNGELSLNRDFIYDSNNNLLEIYTAFSSSFLKATYEYDSNNVRVTNFKSLDNGVTYIPVTIGTIYFDLTFDENENLIHIQGLNTDTIDYLYDSNFNLTSTLIYPSTEINKTYNNNQNPLSQLFNSSNNKKRDILVLLTNNLWENIISPNSFNEIYGQGIGDYDINNTFVSGFLTKSVIDLDNFSNGSIDSKTIHVFSYE
jgi:hypothetical protein